MFNKKPSDPIAIGDKPSVCVANTMVDSRIALWCGLEDPKKIEQIASARLRHAEHTLVLGTNAEYSAALRCKSGDDMRDYKKILASWEIQTLNAYLIHELRAIETKEGARRILKLLNVLENRDLVLKDMCTMAEAYLKTQMDKLSDDDETAHKKDMNRDELKNATIGRLKRELSSVDKTRPFEDSVQYSLCICPTPKREAQKWRDDVMAFRARKGTFPIGAVNSTHVVIIYCDPKASFDEYDLTAEFVTLPQNSLRSKTEWKMTFRVPKVDSDQGFLIHVAMDTASPRCIIGMASYIFILDPRNDKRTVYQFTESRTVSCVTLDNQMALAGTTQGEVFRFDEDSVYVYNTPKIEPILKAVWLPKPKIMCMMTCMSIFIETTNGRMQVDTLRPVTFHADDEILAVYCKYGFVQVQPIIMTNLVNSFDPIENDDVSDLPAYDGVYMDGKQMIIVESHGRIRVWNPQ